MKRFCSLLPILFSLLLSHQDSRGEAHLKIIQLINYPDTPLTAVMNQPYYNIQIVLTNTGNSSFASDLHIYCQSQSIGITDTLRNGPHPDVILDPGDTVSVTANSPFFFRPTTYAAGDNIIVVWPFASVGNFTFETYHTLVHLLNPDGLNEINKSGMTIYPSPVSKTLNINYGDKNEVEQVRIYDLFGREVYGAWEAVSSIDVSGFIQGMYILEMTKKNGHRMVKKILISNE